jgi:hypothetical protein
MIVIITAVVSASLTWIFSEISHRHFAKRNVADQTVFLHKTEQLKILTELQIVVLDYYAAYSGFLWGRWEELKGSLSKKEKASVSEIWEEMEQTALRMFALSSRIDQLQIRSQVDFLEEIARQYSLFPGESTDGETSIKSSRNVVKQDEEVQRLAIGLNSTIGDHQLRLLGSTNPDGSPE